MGDLRAEGKPLRPIGSHCPRALYRRVALSYRAATIKRGQTMQNQPTRKIDEHSIMAGLAFLLLALALTIIAGMTGTKADAAPPLQALLTGFVPLTLFGLIYRLFPAMKLSKLAKPQFWIYLAGAVIMQAGALRGETGYTELLAFGSIVTFCGAALFAVTFWLHREFRADVKAPFPR